MHGSPPAWLSSKLGATLSPSLDALEQIGVEEFSNRLWGHDQMRMSPIFEGPDFDKETLYLEMSRFLADLSSNVRTERAAS